MLTFVNIAFQITKKIIDHSKLSTEIQSIEMSFSSFCALQLTVSLEIINLKNKLFFNNFSKLETGNEKESRSASENGIERV